MKRLILFSLLFLLAVTFVAADLSCDFEANSTCSSGIKIIGVQNETGGWNNAHAQNFSINTYDNSVCCSSNSTLNNSCYSGLTPTVLLRMFDSDNSHSEQANYSDYSQDVCASVLAGVFSCSYVDGNCTTGTTCVLSMVNADGIGDNGTNAHIGDCSAYDRKLCCSATPYTVCINETGICYPSITNAMSHASSKQMIVLTDNGTYFESVSINKDITITSNSTTGRPTLYSSGYAAIDNENAQNITLRNFNILTNSSAFYGTIGGNNEQYTISNMNFSGNGSSAMFNFGSHVPGPTEIIENTNISCESFPHCIYFSTMNPLIVNNSIIYSNSYGISENSILNYSNISILNTLINTSLDSMTFSFGNASSTVIINNVSAYSDGIATDVLASGVRTLITNSSLISNGSLSFFTYYAVKASDNLTVIDSNLMARLNEPSLFVSPHPYYAASANVSVYVYNSTLNASVRWEDNGPEYNDSVYIINSSSVQIGDLVPSNCARLLCGANVTLWEWVYVNVTRTNGTPVAGADVNASSGSYTILNTTSTNATGEIAPFLAMYYWETNHNVGGGAVNFNNFSFLANYTGIGYKNVSVRINQTTYVTIVLDNTPPNLPNLTLPTDNNTTMSYRYPTFNWTGTDNDSDYLNYVLNISSPAGCAAIPLINVSTNYYASVDKLCVDKTYNWTVMACDYQNCSGWADPFNFSIPSTVGVTFNGNKTIDFGTLPVSVVTNITVRNTSTNDPPPLVYNNTGNVDILTQVSATAPLWSLDPLDRDSFQYQDDLDTSWSNFSASYTHLFSNFSYLSSPRDLQVQITVPIGEGPGAKNTTIVVLGSSLE